MSLKMYYLNAEKQEQSVINIEDNMNLYYELIGCSCVEYVRRDIEHISYAFICDEEGTCKSDPIISAVSQSGQVMLVGNLIISKFDQCGNFVSLTDADIKIIERNICKYQTENHPEGLLMVNCEYPSLKALGLC